MQINGVIFDFNGTLFWDTPFHNKAWDIFLEKHHLKLDDLQKNKKYTARIIMKFLLSCFPKTCQLMKYKA